MRGSSVALFVAAACACGQPPPIEPSGPPAEPAATPAVAIAPPVPAPSSTADAGDDPKAAVVRAAHVLFLDEASREDVAACADVGCLVALRYAGDKEAQRLAGETYAKSSTLVGLLPEQDFDGGYRGQLHLVPELASGKNRQHLSYVAAAARDFETFFGALAQHAKAPMSYRYDHLDVRVFRSVGARTPSAFADGSTVGYNVAGSLNTSADAVRETFFHEIFHLNDADKGGWSERALGATYRSIRTRCGIGDRAEPAKIDAWTACLRPYAPGDTVVRGGTFYAFQPGNEVHEYAAELALRFYKETRDRMASRPRIPPFRCARPENEAAWDALTTTFFGGADMTPPCPEAR